GGTDGVRPLAPGRLEEALEPLVLQERAQQPGGRDDVAPPHAVAGIEIEDQTIGTLQPLDDGVPGVNLEDADLDESDETGQVVHHEVLPDLPLLLDAHASQ